MSQEVMIKLVDIDKSYGEVQVLKGVNLEVMRGQTISIIGLPVRARARCCAASTS